MTLIYQSLLVLGVIYFFKILNISRGFVIIAFTVFFLLIIVQRIWLFYFLAFGSGMPGSVPCRILIFPCGSRTTARMPAVLIWPARINSFFCMAAPWRVTISNPKNQFGRKNSWRPRRLTPSSKQKMMPAPAISRKMAMTFMLIRCCRLLKPVWPKSVCKAL